MLKLIPDSKFDVQCSTFISTYPAKIGNTVLEELKAELEDDDS